MSDQRKKSRESLTSWEFFGYLAWVIGFILLLNVRELFPNSNFVQEKLNGPFGIYWLVLPMWYIAITAVFYVVYKWIQARRERR